MIVLGIDGGLGGFSAAVARDSETLATIELPGQVALEQGLPAVLTVLQQAQVDSAGLDRLGVGIGPGSFTGVRIAISYAKSLAQGWNVPLVGVNSFDAIEAGLQLDDPALTVVRGRKNVISVRYRSEGAQWRESGYVADVLDAIASCHGVPSTGSGQGKSNHPEPVEGAPIAVLGDAEDVLPGLAERGWSVHQVHRVIEPTALAVAIIAAQREPARTLHELRADYGELPAAKIPKLRGAHGESS